MRQNFLSWQQRPWHGQLAVAFGLFDGLRGVCESKTRFVSSVATTETLEE
jgi:hypothetical protein